uniref:Uncharacterized protein n=1 Tax=Ditylenchus dipsaci TaxID=166011 RepID=A0A915D3K5_9BILA
MAPNHLQLPSQRSKSVSKDKYGNHVSRRSTSQIRTHRRQDDYVVKDSGKKGRKNETNLKKNAIDDRPAFNLDTKIDGYDDVDENGRYRRKYSEQPPRKKEIKHDDYSAAWVNSLRDSYNNKKWSFNKLIQPFN